MILPVGPSGGPSTPVAGATFSPLSLLQALKVPVAQGLTATEVLRTRLTPLHQETSYQARLGLSDPVREDLGHFVERRHEEPSESLLSELTKKAQVIHGILSGSTTGSIRRPPLQYDETSETTNKRHDEALREAVDRMLVGIHEGARTSQAAVPPAISLTDVMEHPEKYRGEKPLEIVLFDVDGTTHLGETFLEGQYSIEWLVRDIVRYGPKAAAGIGWWKILKAIPGIIKLRLQERKLRLQEKKKEHADKEEFSKTMGPLIKGVDGNLIEESIRRFFKRYGSRGVSEFMLDEFKRHRQAGRLIIGVSASPELMVKLHAEKDLKIPVANMMGTTIVIDPETDRATGEFCWLHDEGKVAALEDRIFGRLREKGISFRVVAGYSDSPSDLPMLERVRADGGIVYATNTSTEDFKGWALDGGMSVEEKVGWINEKGKRTVTIFSSPQAGELSYTTETSPRRREWVNDLDQLAVRAVTDGVGIAMAAPVAQAAHQALSNGDVDWSLGLLSSAPSMAVGGMIASAAAAVLVPPDGPVSWQRRVMMRGVLPVTTALVASGAIGPFGLSAALATAAVACAGVELVTIGERVTGLRRWKGGDERKNPIGKAIGFGGLRALQFAAFEALMYGLQHLFGH